MGRVMTLFRVTAIVVLAAGAAQAGGFILPFNAGGVATNGGDYDIYSQTINNELQNSFCNYPGYYSSPSAPVDGAIWINRGGGPVMLTTAVNAQLLVDDPYADWGPTGNGSGYSAAGWVEMALLLNSDGSSAGDFSSGFPGAFVGPSVEQSVPGTSWYWYYNHTDGQKTWYSGDTFQMQLNLWTGPETTYAQAVADGQYTGSATWTETCFSDAYYGVIQVPAIPGDIDNPAIIMTVAPTPEPSTLLLAGTALLGLLAYAWRKGDEQ
jgi:hypothetical protein